MEPTVLEPAVLTSLQGSNYLGCSGDVLKISRATGNLWSNPAPQFIKAGARKILYRKSDLDAFLNQFEAHSSNAEVAANG